MSEGWLCSLRAWASANGNVRELWLFGSRASGRSQAGSDVDLALVLVPPTGKHNWALGNYFDLHPQWKRQLEEIVDRHVSLEAILPGTKEDAEVRRSGILLWSHDGGAS